MKKRNEVSEALASCSRLGIRLTRAPTEDEAAKFVEDGVIPVAIVHRDTFVSAKRIDSLPDGSYCLCCGRNLAGQPGYVVELKGSGYSGYHTVCVSDYEAIVPAPAAPAPAPEPDVGGAAEANSPEPKKATAGAGGTDVEAALAALASALKANKPDPVPKVDEKAIIAEAVKAAQEEARGFMQKSVADFIRGGGPAASQSADAEAGEPEAAQPKAVGDGVKEASSAAGWSAKATPAAKKAVETLSKFLSEFSYFRNGVSMRLINTFARSADKAAVLKSYCEVSQMEDLSDLEEKMKSPEFTAVCDEFKAFSPQPLNRRFAVFYGAPGGGKTYAAIKAGEKINGGKVDVVPCSPSMDAADTLYAYRLDYRTGKRGYVPTALLKAMVAGRAVVLDEVNLLPMEARMFLQNILDNKDRVHIMGQEIPIADGFFVIGTMNLETGLGSTPLPLPLVDRACIVKEFRTSVSQAAVGAGLC